jgi:hypothetical protein
MYIGWDRKAVDAAANRHAREEAAQREEQAEQEAERAAEHKKYLADMKKKTTKGHMSPSPIGRYTIDCQAIENNWPGEAENMTLSIQPTQTSGVFQVHFDFGILKGMMMISSDESALAPFSADNEDDEDDDDSEGDTNDDPHERPATGSKRKATTTKGRGPSKTTKKDAGRKSTKYFLRMKSRETGEGQINPVAENGTITFKGSDFASFTGQADEMNCVGQGVVFTGRKVSDVPRKSHEQWKDYSWAAYEHARISRW